MVDAPMTLSAVTAAAADQLRRAGIDDPDREAARIWRWLDSDLSIAMNVQSAISEGDAARYLAAVTRRAAGEPLAHATGWAGFRHLTLRSDARALIPRPETEGLVELALACARTGVAVDVGTGTGAIALALRQEGDFDRVIGIDVSPDSLSLARENGERTGLDVSWLEGDLLEPLGTTPADLIVSNPPYLSRREHDALDRSVRDHEPRLALVGGDGGTELTERLLRAARERLRPGGWTVVEIDASRGAQTAAIARAAGFDEVSVREDLFGRERYLLARQRRA